MRRQGLTRRELLKAGASAEILAPGLLPASLRQLLETHVACGQLTDIKKVVIFIQENRSSADNRTPQRQAHRKILSITNEKNHNNSYSGDDS